jgi:hypothetical protein
MIRLYQAYFGRLPDASGGVLTNKSRGRRPEDLEHVRCTNEFKTKYGTSPISSSSARLQNVLGRPVTAVLLVDEQARSQAEEPREVMVGFSESGEYKTKTRGLKSGQRVHGLFRWVPLPQNLRPGGRSSTEVRHGHGNRCAVPASPAYDPGFPDLGPACGRARPTTG